MPNLTSRVTRSADGSQDNYPNDMRLDDGRPLLGNFFLFGAIVPESQSKAYYTEAACRTLSNGCAAISFSALVSPLQDEGLNFNVIKGYPELMLAGSKWGYAAETIGTNIRRTSSNGIEYSDLADAIALTGYPAFADSIPSTIIKIDASESGHVGAQRDVMFESWFHDICQNTGQGNKVDGTPLVGSLENMGGTGTLSVVNNCLLEVMVHLAPVSHMQSGFSDSSQGTQNPAQYYCGNSDGSTRTFTIGGQEWEIWYGRNGQNNDTFGGGQTTRNGQLQPNGALVVFNRLGPAGSVAAGGFTTDLTNEGEWQYDHSAILNFARTQLQAVLVDCNAWGNGGVNSQWTNPQSPDNPFVRMNESGCASVGGIEAGLEPYRANANGDPIEVVFNTLDVIVDGESTGPLPAKLTEACEIDFNLVQGGCPVAFNLFGCSVFFNLIADNLNFELDVASCDLCPCYLGPPLVLTPGGNQYTYNLGQFADFGDVTNVELLGVDSVDTNSSYLITGDQVKITSPASILQPLTGYMQLSLQYDNCAGDGKITCTLQVPVYVVEETIPGSNLTVCVEQGEFAVIPVVPVLDTAIETTPPLCDPDFGTMVFQNDQWTHQYEPGEFGVTEVILPVYRGGNQAKATLRRIQICVKPPDQVYAPLAGCRCVLEAKACGSDTYLPVGKVTQANFAGSIDGVQSFVSMVTKQRHQISGGTKTFTLSINGELETGGSRQSALQLGQYVDLRIRSFYEDTGDIQPVFEGKVFINSANIPWQGESETQTFSISAESDGSYSSRQYGII